MASNFFKLQTSAGLLIRNAQALSSEFFDVCDLQLIKQKT
jgi:hypothetical protein